MSAGHNTRVRCKPGDRCRIVAGGTYGFPSPNIGRIVVVVRPYHQGETVGGCSDWLPDGSDGGRHWVVASLGDGLVACTVVAGRTVGAQTVMSIPISDHRLVPLDDDKGGIEESALRRTPRPVRVSEGAKAS